MTLVELRLRTRRYVRDTLIKRFSETEIDAYLNEGVDRLRSYYMFVDMPYINTTDDISYLPIPYHYALALYASSRCFGVDNDFYQEEEKRNEFENIFADLVTEIENGRIIILDATDTAVVDAYEADYVTEEYFDTTSDEVTI